MRPDLEDYEELEAGDAPRSRAMSWLVLVVAVGGFAALAYYAYHSGSQSMRDGQVLVVEADPSPIKETPEDPQGESFPNQDKTIYDAISPSGRQQAEKLLPEPEEPVIPEPAVTEAAPAPAQPKASGTTTFVNKALTENDPTMDPVDAQSLKQAPPPAAPEAKEASRTRVEPTDDDPIGAPAMVNVKPTTPQAAPKAEPKPAPKPEPVVAAAPKPAPAPAPAPAAASGGAYKIQLGAFKSDAEARQQWSKITGKHGDVVKGSPIVVRADLSNGTFYRLRAGGFASADAAKAACAKLSARGQGCFFAGQ